MSELPPNYDPFDQPARKIAGMSRAEAWQLVDAVSERDDLALSAAAYELEDGSWAIEATCDGEPELESFSELARQTLGGDITFSKERVDPEIDWVSRTQEGLAPVLAGGFFIHGSHDRANAPAGARAIEIDAAQAFGTGHHETTTGCLEAIDTILRVERPRHVIDVGTGTGVLAIALAKRLRQPIIATDIDPVAVRIASQNAKKNGVAAFVRPFQATGMDHAEIIREAPYDLIVANILAKPLVALAADMAELATPRAHLVLSGLLTEQAPRVLAAYRATGFVLKRRLIRGNWATLILGRG
ncbi:MAG: 50S ribosomal protein L11 methyltransferase [Hyphomicrobiaceae bacterium]|nr:50S ribosomal protein L11 methyltransferase [Hyphomicrobiaceae bacterium]MCC0024870.1 50S ribosomal protein L11 methyltransferase [Hyphomicrobiaceae bacterium]